MTPWSTASFLILVAAIIFAMIARGHSVEAKMTMARAVQAQVETRSDGPVKAAKPLVDRQLHANRVFWGIGIGLAGLGLLTWLVSLISERRDGAYLTAILLAVYGMLSILMV